MTGTSVMIVWPASANAASYLVYRSADGGAPSWRGKVDIPGLSFTDPLRAGPLFTYSVVARAADATVATATVCSPSVRL